jgi:ketosteroid isomerase-like protein
MSQSQIDIVKNIYAAFTRRDRAYLESVISPEVEIFQSPEVPWGGAYRGHEGLQQFFGKLMAHLKASGLPIERALDAGDCVVIIGRTQGTVLANGKPYDVPLVHIWQFRDGQVIRFMPHIDHPTMFASLR